MSCTTGTTGRRDRRSFKMPTAEPSYFRRKRMPNGSAQTPAGTNAGSRWNGTSDLLIYSVAPPAQQARHRRVSQNGHEADEQHYVEHQPPAAVVEEAFHNRYRQED